MMKKIVFIMLCILVVLSGCFTAKENETSFMDDWLRAADLQARETPEMLYEKAKQEGILTIYTVSTRMMDVAKSFERQYPGLVTKVLDLRADEMIERVKKNGESGVYESDIIFCTDVDGSLSKDLIPNKLAFKYTPYDIADKMLPGYDEEYLSVLGEVIVIGYNDLIHSKSPVSNWWELTEEQWRGKVYAPNPAKSVTTLAALSMMQKYEQELEKAYYERYGEKLVSQNGEGATETFIRRLFENGLNIVNSSDEAAEAIGAPGFAEDNVCIIVSSKIRLREIGYNIAISYETVPFNGFVNPVNISVAGGAKNVSAAKLFIRWILGETDGAGEGYKPFLQNGAWSTRVDVKSESTFALDDADFIYTDGSYVYEHRSEILAFWEKVLAERERKTP